MCANHHICATCPKGAPTIGQLGPRFRLPASGLSPWLRGDSWVGARWPTLSLVLPSVLGVPLSQCLLEVPSSCTPVPVLPRATSWSPALALPFHAETLVLHLLLLSPLSWDRFGVSQWKDCRAQALSEVPSSSFRPVPQGSSPKTWLELSGLPGSP